MENLKSSVAILNDSGEKIQNDENLAVDEGMGVYLLASGSAEYPYAKENSKMAVDIAHGVLINNDLKNSLSYGMNIRGFKEDLFREHLRYAMKNVNDHLLEKGSKRGVRAGSTLDCLFIKKETYRASRCAVGHLGDGRVYVGRDSELEQITTDPKERNPVTEMVGFEKNINPQIIGINLQPKDYVFMCSHGVYEAVDSKKLKSGILDKDLDLQERLINIAKMVYKGGAKDNLSMILYQHKESA